MLDLLIYLFENYLSTKPKLNMTDITLELEEAGFKNQDISSAFEWFNHLEKLSEDSKLTDNDSLRVLSPKEYEKISKTLKKGSTIALRIIRDKNGSFLTLKIPK